MGTTGLLARLQQASRGIRCFLEIHRPPTVCTMRITLSGHQGGHSGEVELFPQRFHTLSIAYPQGLVNPPDAAKPPPRASSEGRWLLFGAGSGGEEGILASAAY